MRELTGERLMQQFQPLGGQIGRHVREAGDVTSRSRQVRHHSVSHGVSTERDDDRHAGRCALCSPHGRPNSDDHVDIARDQFGGKLRQTIQASVGPAIVNSKVLPLM